MATKKLIPIVLLLTASTVGLVACTGEAHSPAVLQGSCPPLAIPVGKECKLAKEVATLLGQGDADKAQEDLRQLNAHLINPQVKVRELVTVKPGQGLVAATKATALPLTTKQAIALGREYERTIYLFIRPDGGRQYDVLVYPNEQLALLDEGGKLRWVLQKK